ncbi:hypothetical protein [Enterovirga sp.]|jgi:hypothetical protein|uniref:hypothetical protein n=1 Tax=Enterovirga sp. TaxID=2026350 RepID=UPI0026322732|nr:hypothetical protein [Enterovirga sp.]MDB5589578.1 hypothetical protein [Enterovirga sp.]
MAAKISGFAGLALAALAAAPGSAQPRPDMTELQARTAEIAHSYLRSWSLESDGAASAVPFTYGPTVRFYGQTLTQAQLADAKRRMVRLWPVRRYQHRPGTLKVTCNAAQLRCGAQSTIDYEVRNPARGTAARGSTTLDLGVSFAGPRPVILYESGRVRGRDPSA